MQKIWKQKTPLCWTQICISTGTLVPSLLWHFLHHFFSIHFVLSIDNFNTVSRKMMNLYFAVEIQASFWFAENSVPRLHKAQYRYWRHSSERSPNLHMHHQKPTTGHIPDWKTNTPQKMSKNIYDCISFLYFCKLHADNLGVQNMPKLLE